MTAPANEVSARAVWFDPLRWSWVVRAHGLFLAVAVVSEYQKLIEDAFEAWLPPEGGAEISVVLLPLCVSQFLTVCWMFFVARIRAPSEDQLRPITVVFQTLEARFPNRRRPRVLTGRVAQPHAVSVLGVRFLIVPPRGAETWKHYLGEDGVSAYRAVLTHELGHFESWDDLLFFPVFVYLACSVLVWIAMAARVTGVDSFGPPMTHLVALAGLGLLAVFVVRRREAYADAFSVLILGDLKPIRRALERLPDAGASEPGAIALHFGARERLLWLEERGRRFLDLRRADLAVLALVWYGAIEAPSMRFAGLSSTGNFSRHVLTLSSSMLGLLMEILLMLAVSGWMVARAGRLPRFRELLLPAVIAAIAPYIGSVGSSEVTGFAWLVESVVVGVMIAFSKTLPFTLVVFVLSFWTRSIILRAGSGTRERVVFFSTTLAAAKRIIILSAGFLALGPLARFVQALSGGQLEPGELLRMFGIALLALFLMVSLFAAVAVWALFSRDRTGRVLCIGCGQEARAIPQKLSPSCTRCGALLRPDFGMEVLA